MFGAFNARILTKTQGPDKDAGLSGYCPTSLYVSIFGRRVLKEATEPE